MLSLYEDCLGQTINKDKSTIMFSKNSTTVEKENVMAGLGIQSEGRNETYLGLPIYMGRSRSQTFSYLKDRVWKRLQGWKERLLSKAGNEILIKSVVQSIPTYAMSCFDLTKTLCNELGSLVCRFWWAQQENENKVHWVSWELLCRRKEQGGIGYRDLHLFNLAMLARQGWRLIMEPMSLCAQVLRAKYFPTGDLMAVREKLGISYSWRSIVRGIQALKKGLIWRVGDGTNIDIWHDPWLPSGITRRPITPRGRTVVNKVTDLIDPTTGKWDKELIEGLFWEEDVKQILTIPIREGVEDGLAWHFDNRGYHVLEDERR